MPTHTAPVNATPGRSPSRDAFIRRARTGFTTSLAGLVVQFLLGMYNNLFVDLDARHATAPIAAHILLGLLLAITGAATLIFARRGRHRALVLAAGAGAASTLLALVAGFAFLDNHNDVYSATMAVGFMLTVVSDIIGLLLATKPTATARP